jgi:glycogen(starch) synthase
MVRHLAQALARAQHSVHLVTYGYGEADAQPVAEPPAAPAFFHHRAGSSRAGSLRSGPRAQKLALDAHLLRQAIEVARTHQCEVVHAHSFEALVLGLLLKTRLHLPVIYHAHSALGPELPTYYRLSFLRLAARLAGTAFDRLLPRLADATIVFDADQRAWYESQGVDAARLHVIPPGIDVGELGDRDPAHEMRLQGELGEGPWLVYAGNPDRYQSLPLLWAALGLLRHRHPGVRVLVATHHPAELFSQAIDDAGVGDLVRICRYREPSELRSLLAVATLGVCPRVLPCGAPIKILNYLAAGLPVVACRSSAQHLVASPECGRLVDANPGAFAQGIVELLGLAGHDRCDNRAASHATYDHDVRDGGAGLTGGALARACRRASEPFRIEHQINSYEAVYNAVRVSDFAKRAPIL